MKMKTEKESNIICVICGSDMKKISETDVVCYKCTNIDCGYSFCERLKL